MKLLFTWSKNEMNGKKHKTNRIQHKIQIFKAVFPLNCFLFSANQRFVEQGQIIFGNMVKHSFKKVNKFVEI